MSQLLRAKSRPCCKHFAEEVFEDLRFDAFKTDMGIVGTRWEDDRPIIFKTNPGKPSQGPNRSNPASDARSLMP